MARTSRKHLAQHMSVQEIKPLIWLVGEYLRLSDEDERDDEQTSIGNQDIICRNYLETEDNISIVDTYIDNGRTGTNFNRPDFERMLSDLKAKRINCIIVKDLSRFGRNFLETSEYIEKVFPRMGVRFIAVNNNYDSAKVEMAQDGITIPFFNMTNELYSKDTSKKINASIQTMVANEEFIPSSSSIPYGYLRDAENNTYQVDWETAFVVKMIFELRALDYSVNRIVDILNRKEIKCPGKLRYDRGMCKAESFRNAFWIRGTVRKILRNEAYIGHRIYGTVKREKIGGKKVRQTKDKWVYAYNKHQPLVSEELFYRVQKLMDEAENARKQMKAREKVSVEEREFFYKKVFCGDCGAQMITGKRLQRKTSDLSPALFYQCNRYTETSHVACSNHYISQATLISTVTNAIRMQVQLLFESEKFLQAESLQSIVEEKRKEFRKELVGINTKLTENEKHLERILMDYNEGVITMDEFRYMKEKYTKNKREWSKQKENLEKNLPQFEKRSIGVTKWLKDIQKFQKDGNLDRNLVAALISKILVYEDKRIEIEFTFCDEIRRFANDLESRGF